MCCREVYQGILLIVLLVAQGLTDTSFDVCDDLAEQCDSGEYLSTSYNDSNCTKVCDIFGSGSGTECLACNSLCASCYGPANNQCYSCESYSIMIEEGDETDANDQFICGDGVIRNVSLSVVMCVPECSDEFVSNDNKECICPEGRYLSSNRSSCLECNSLCSSCSNGTETGCLSCSVVAYNGQCMVECPSGTVNVNGVCEMESQRELFPIDRITLFSIIGAAGFFIFFCVAWVCCTIYCCFYNEKRKNKNYLLTTEGGTSISESFKKVKRNISIKKRPPRPLSTANPILSEQAYARQQIVSESYDPYFEMNGGSELNRANTELSQYEPSQPTVQFELQSKTPVEDEEVYMQMTPATSVENVNNENSNQRKLHKNVSLTKSYEPPTNTSRVNVSRRTSLPYTSEYFNEEDVYVNNEDLAGELSQENYVVMNLSNNNEQEEYIAPSDLIMNSQTYHDQDEEQELYMEMETQPPIPRKSVLPATQPKKNTGKTRKDTLDNEYVKITGSDQKLRNYLSDEQLAPKYVNVQRSGDPRLRSVTSPALTANVVKKGELDEQPIYQNFEDEEESYYGIVD